MGSRGRSEKRRLVTEYKELAPLGQRHLCNCYKEESQNHEAEKEKEGNSVIGPFLFVFRAFVIRLWPSAVWLHFIN